MSLDSLENISDDEVFFGKISIKEAKKRLFLNSYCDRQSLPDTFELKKENKNDDSLQIIETNSEPNVSYVRPSLSSPNSITNATIKSTGDSFLKYEKMVSEICVSPKSYNELNNTLEIVEYILNNPTSKDSSNPNKDEKYLKQDLVCDEHLTIESKNTLDSNEKEVYETKITIKNEENDKLNFLQETPSKIKVEYNESNHKKALIAPIDLNTPIKQSEQVFKTPKTLHSARKPITSATKKTPKKVNAYQHVASPIAVYIKNCPQVPLIKNVHLKKPLNNASFIPKMGKSAKEHKATNQENISLPSVAYKSAKRTKLISIPETEIMPSSQCIEKMTNSLLTPLVIKHSHREVTPICKCTTSKNDDSFVGLPLKQADLSVCTKKSAFTKFS